MINNFNKTIIAQVSPNGRGAISLIRLSGKEAHQIALKIINKSVFKKEKELHWLFDQNKQKFDQALLLIFSAPNSFTGEDTIEFCCHGSPIIVNKIIETCLHYGAALASPGEFSQRAFLNGKMNLLQAESIMDLISAKSQKLLQAANYGLDGSLKNQIENLKSELTRILGLIHGPLDFPVESEEAEIDFEQIYELLEEICKKIQKLLQKSRQNSVFRTGLKTIILGRPNVGKSSLLNWLLEEERAIVSSEAGTTRDFLAEEILIRDIPITLIDTAGLRQNAQSKIEEIGIQKALNLSKAADLILFVFDFSEGWTKEDQELFEALPKNIKVLTLGNKCDLSKNQVPNFEFIEISVQNNLGLNNLENALLKMLEINELESDFEINLNQRQMSLFIQALKSLEDLNKNLPIEFVSVKIEESLNYLEQVLGQNKFASDQALNAIFANFCIGK